MNEQKVCNRCGEGVLTERANNVCPSPKCLERMPQSEAHRAAYSTWEARPWAIAGRLWESGHHDGLWWWSQVR